ncbi:MAG: hypothetical protein ACI4TE_07050 [Alphaproteobacteria bacterium]
MATTVLNATATSTNVKSWEKTTTDTYADTIRTARDMGQARLNYSRLNMITTLSENEKEDWFSFTVTSRGKLRLTAVNLSAANKDKEKDETTATDELDAAASNFEKAIEQFKGQGLKVEVYQYVSNRQTLIATNEEGKGDQTEAFEQLMRGEYKVNKAGTFYIHVTTKDGEPVSEDTLYALQVQLGDKYKHDYITQEQSIDHTQMTEGDIALAKAEAAAGSVMASGSVLAAQGACDILSAGYTNLATLRASKDDSAASRILSLLA